VTKRNSGRRGRSRKRNRSANRLADTSLAPAPGGRTADADSPPAPAPAPARARQRRAQAEPRPASYRDPGGVGDRPEAPWHPWPFSELLIFAGAIGSLIGFASKQQPLLFASLGAVMLGTLEFTIREHRSGYRAHTAMLAAVPVALMHGGLALGLFAAGIRGEVLVVLPVLLDIPVFWVLFRTLRGQFEDARRERVFALKRR
jgi:hypothetical protein